MRGKEKKGTKIIYLKGFLYNVRSPTPHVLYWKEAENKIL